MTKKLFTALLLLISLSAATPSYSARVEPNCPAGFASLEQARKLTTDRLVLAPIQKEDFPKAVAVYMDPQVQKMSGDVYQEGTFYHILGTGQRNMPSEAAHLRTINMGIKDKDGNFLGITQLGGHPYPQQHTNIKEIAELPGTFALTGYHLKPEAWGKGIMSEANAKLYAYAFEDMKLDGLFATVLPDNTGSVKMLQKQGFIKTAGVGEFDHYDHYFLSRDAYLKKKAAGPAKPDTGTAIHTAAEPVPVPKKRVVDMNDFDMNGRPAQVRYEIQDYLKKNWRDIKSSEYREYLDYLDYAFFDKEEFLKSPKAFIESYPRSGFDMIQYPKDPAFGFLNELYKKGELDDFVNMLKMRRPATATAAARPVPATEVGHYPANVRAAVTQASAERPVHLRVTLPKSDEAEALDDSFRRLGLNPERTSNGNEDTILITVSSQRQVGIMDQLMDMMKGQVKSTTIARDITKRAPALPPNISSAVNKALANASKERPVYIELGVSGVDDADEMDKALRSAGFKVKGYGFPLESFPPQGSRTVTITNQAEAQKLRDIMAKYQEAIGSSGLKSSVSSVPKPQNLSETAFKAMDDVSKEHPVTLTIGVARGERAENMDILLRSIDPKMEGQGFPLESLPPQGTRTITITDPLQAERLVDMMDSFRDEIRRVELKRPGQAAPSAAVSKALPRNLPAPVKEAMVKASEESPVVIRLGVYGVDEADGMDRALVQAFGSKVQGRGFPLESMPPQGGRTVTLTSKSDAEKLEEILNRYQRSIGRAELAPAPRPVAAKPAAPSLAKPVVEPKAREQAFLDNRFGHMDQDAIKAYLKDNYYSKDAFLNDPKKFVEDAIRKRGGTEEFRGNSDAALSFMEDLLRNGDLEAFTLKLKAARAIGPALKVDAVEDAFLKGKWSHMPEYHQDIKLYLNDHYYSKPEFLDNPKKFLEGVIRERGGTEELRIPSDPAQNFIEDLARKGQLEEFARNLKANRPAAVPRPTGIQDEVANMPKAQMKSYLDSKWGHMKEHHADIEDYLEKNYFSNPEFLGDPKGFFERNGRRASAFDLLSVPQDPANRFIEEMYRKGELEEFVKKLKAANPNLKAAPPARASAQYYPDAVRDVVGKASSENPVHLRITMPKSDMAEDVDDALKRLNLNPERTSNADSDTILITLNKPHQANVMDQLMDMYKGNVISTEIARDIAKRAPALPRALSNPVNKALATASKEKPVYVDLGVSGVEEADEMDKALRSAGFKVQGYGYPLESMPPQGSRRVTIMSQEQAQKLRELMAKYEKAIGSSRLEAGPIVYPKPRNLTDDAYKAVQDVSAQKPVTLELNVMDSERADNMEYFLKGVDPNVQGDGFPLQSLPRQGTRIITIKDPLQAEHFLDSMDVFQNEIRSARLSAGARAPAAPVAAALPRNMPAAVRTAIEGATSESPVLVRLSVRGVDEAGEMDRALIGLREHGMKVEGQGFPLESLPPQGGRSVTVYNKEQGDKLQEVMGRFTRAIGGSSAEMAPSAASVKKMLQGRLDTKWGHMKEDHPAILKYLEDNYFSKQAFRDNPRKFYEDARTKRGGAEYFTSPGDPALDIIGNLYENGKIGTLVKTLPPLVAPSADARKAKQLDKLRKWNEGVRGSTGSREPKEDPRAEQLRQLEEAKRKRLERLQRWNEQIRNSDQGGLEPNRPRSSSEGGLE